MHDDLLEPLEASDAVLDAAFPFVGWGELREALPPDMANCLGPRVVGFQKLRALVEWRYLFEYAGPPYTGGL